MNVMGPADTERSFTGTTFYKYLISTDEGADRPKRSYQYPDEVMQEFSQILVQESHNSPLKYASVPLHAVNGNIVVD